MSKHSSVGKQKTLFVTSLTRIAAVALFVSIAYGTANENTNRTPAAVSKEAHIHSSLKERKFMHTSKLVPNVKINIEKDNNFLSSIVGEIRLKATAVSSASMPELKLNWVVPDSIEIIEGETEHQFNDVKNDFEQVVYLTIKPNKDTNEHVRLKATGYNGAYLYSVNTVYNTLNQDAINESSQKLVKKNEEFLEQQN